MPSVEIQAPFGLILLDIVGIFGLLHIYGQLLVADARRKFNVSPPTLYADKSLADADKFNAVQRSVQNRLESSYIVVALLLGAGLKHPVLAALAGAVWVVSSYYYIQGYKSSNMRGRRNPFYISGYASIALAGLTLLTAVQMLLF